MSRCFTSGVAAHAMPRLLKEEALGPFNDLLRRASDLAAEIEAELTQPREGE